MQKDYCCLNGDHPKLKLVYPDLFDTNLGNRTIYEKLSYAHNNLKQGIKRVHLRDSKSGLLNLFYGDMHVYFFINYSGS